MALTESGANTQDISIINSLKILFGEDFEKDGRLKEVLEVVIHNGGTQGERVFRITKSGFSEKIRASLSNINGGITHDEFGYPPNHPDYGIMLDIINKARKLSGKNPLPDRRPKLQDPAMRVATTLDITE